MPIYKISSISLVKLFKYKQHSFYEAFVTIIGLFISTFRQDNTLFPDDFHNHEGSSKKALQNDPE
jgi:hypothetical protein